MPAAELAESVPMRFKVGAPEDVDKLVLSAMPGVPLAYTPQVTQAVQLRETLAESPFGMAETIEVLQRGWHIEGQSVRPDHRMVAHTGFLTHARLLGSPT